MRSIFYLFVVVLLTITFSQESLCLTMRALQNMPTNDDPRFYFPEESDRADTASRFDRTFVRTIGTVGGREIVPRRWTTQDRVAKVVVDEDGIAIPVRKSPLLSRILGRPGGI